MTIHYITERVWDECGRTQSRRLHLIGSLLRSHATPYFVHHLDNPGVPEPVGSARRSRGRMEETIMADRALEQHDTLAD